MNLYKLLYYVNNNTSPRYYPLIILIHLLSIYRVRKQVNFFAHNVILELLAITMS
jgi:hypothetical protein